MARGQRGTEAISGKIVSINISKETGTEKIPTERGELMEEWGLKGDAHASSLSKNTTLSHRQISLLAMESIEKMRDKGADVAPGSFGENLTTRGIDLVNIPVGTKLYLSGGIVLEVTQIGKQCHDRCAIYYSVGDCVMPREGIFARVISGGLVSPEDRIEVQENIGEEI